MERCSLFVLFYRVYLCVCLLLNYIVIWFVGQRLVSGLFKMIWTLKIRLCPSLVLCWLVVEMWVNFICERVQCGGRLNIYVHLAQWRKVCFLTASINKTYFSTFILFRYTDDYYKTSIM